MGQGDAGSYGPAVPDKGSEGVDFLDLSDATAGVELKLPPQRLRHRRRRLGH